MQSKILLTRRKVEDSQNIKSKLFPHQVSFLNKASLWEKQGHGGLLGAEMGTGKTLMILSLFASNVTNGIPKRTLIIAPLALLENWRNEYIKHLNLPPGSVTIYHGKQRHLTPLKERYLVITSYETIRQDIKRWFNMSPLIADFNPERLVLDEAHEVKNQMSERFQALLIMPGKLRWVMTGTPIQNYRKDLESLSAFIGLAPYSDPSWWSEDSGDQLKQWKSESYIYFSKNDINTKLPERHYNNHILSFSEEEERLYKEMKDDACEAFEDYLDGTQKQFSTILTKILRLKQFCDHQYIPLHKEQRDELDFKESTKTKKFIDILLKIPQSEKIIVFSQFIDSLNMLQKSLDNNGFENEHLIYHGGMSKDQKDDVLRSFQNNDSKRVLLMSIKAGGVGLNLVRANHIVLFDPWWNRAIEEQALARVHRIGQVRDVNIHRITIKGSIEQWIISLQEHKLDSANQILNDDYVEQEHNFSRENLKILFQETCY